MKKLHNEEEKRPRERRALRWALAGAVMLSGLGCTAVNRNVPTPAMQQVQPNPGTYDDNAAGTTSVMGLRAKVLFPSKPVSQMVFESSWYRRSQGVQTFNGVTSQGIQTSDSFTSYIYEASVLRQVWEDNHTMIANFEFVFSMNPSTHRECVFFAKFPRELDRTQFSDPRERGSRMFPFEAFPEQITRDVHDVVVVVDFTVGLPGSMTAHAIPRDVEGHLLGATPEGQLAYSITFYPISQRAYGGWSVLR